MKKFFLMSILFFGSMCASEQPIEKVANEREDGDQAFYKEIESNLPSIIENLNDEDVGLFNKCTADLDIIKKLELLSLFCGQNKKLYHAFSLKIHPDKQLNLSDDLKKKLEPITKQANDYKDDAMPKKIFFSSLSTDDKDNFLHLILSNDDSQEIHSAIDDTKELHANKDEKDKKQKLSYNRQTYLKQLLTFDKKLYKIYSFNDLMECSEYVYRYSDLKFVENRLNALNNLGVNKKANDLSDFLSYIKYCNEVSGQGGSKSLLAEEDFVPAVDHSKTLLVPCFDGLSADEQSYIISQLRDLQVLRVTNNDRYEKQRENIKRSIARIYLLPKGHPCKKASFMMNDVKIYEKYLCKLVVLKQQGKYLDVPILDYISFFQQRDQFVLKNKTCVEFLEKLNSFFEDHYDFLPDHKEKWLEYQRCVEIEISKKNKLDLMLFNDIEGWLTYLNWAKTYEQYVVKTLYEEWKEYPNQLYKKINTDGDKEKMQKSSLSDLWREISIISLFETDEAKLQEYFADKMFLEVARSYPLYLKADFGKIVQNLNNGVLRKNAGNPTAYTNYFAKYNELHNKFKKDLNSKIELFLNNINEDEQINDFEGRMVEKKGYLSNILTQSMYSLTANMLHFLQAHPEFKKKDVLRCIKWSIKKQEWMKNVFQKRRSS